MKAARWATVMATTAFLGMAAVSHPPGWQIGTAVAVGAAFAISLDLTTGAHRREHREVAPAARRTECHGRCDLSDCLFPLCVVDVPAGHHLHTFTLSWSENGRMWSNGICNGCGEIVHPELLARANAREARP